MAVKSSLKILSQSKCFEGIVTRYEHFSEFTKTAMKFAVFVPAIAEKKLLPVSPTL